MPSSRQLVTRDRPFSPRIIYVTSALVAALHVLWLALVGALGWLHRDRISALRAKVIGRIARRPDPTAPPAADPVAPF